MNLSSSCLFICHICLQIHSYGILSLSLLLLFVSAQMVIEYKTIESFGIEGAAMYLFTFSHFFLIIERFLNAMQNLVSNKYDI